MWPEVFSMIVAALLLALATAWWSTRRQLTHTTAALHAAHAEKGLAEQHAGAQVAQLQAALAQLRVTVEGREDAWTREEAAARQRYDELTPVLDGYRSHIETVHNHARPLHEGLSELQSVQTIFERWHDGMDELLKQNADMHRKNEDFAQIVRQMTIVTLNASIEAARIGELGRGFTVVAEEMRGLAKRAEKLSSDYRRGLYENDLLTTSTFQDIQASGKLIVGTIAALELSQRQVMDSLERARS